MEKERGFSEIISVDTVKSTNWWVLGELSSEIEGCLKRKEEEDIGGQGKACKNQGKAKENPG